MLQRPRHPRPLHSIVAVVLTLSLGGALSACAPGVQGASPDPAPTTPGSASATPDTEPVEEPTDAGADPAALLLAELSAAITSGETDSLDARFTDPVRVVIASSEADNEVAPLDAVLALDYVQPGVGTWEWDLPEATIAGYRASEYYRDCFPADVIVGRSSEGPVVAFSPEGDKVDTILMAIDEDLLFF